MVSKAARAAAAASTTAKSASNRRANGGKIGQFSQGHLLKRAKEICDEKAHGSQVFDPEAEERIPKFDRSELELGRVLGRGGFCVVSEITGVKLKENANNNSSQTKKRRQDAEDEHQISNIVQDRSFMESHYLRDGKDARYALKILKDEAFSDPQTFVNGVVDLAIEAQFLAVVRHPNIIKMRAFAMGNPFSVDYFVVLDRLYDVLSRRITWWKKRDVKGFKKLFDPKGKKQIALWLERITVGYDLACALKYLHQCNIIYRDLKPDNIGFDVRGDVKIFDFGLAKEIHVQNKLEDGTYKMTGDTGSPRYMAPEVALGMTYNETADCYSFGILMWQLCQLETPFQGFTMNMFDKKVTRGGARPKCSPKWPKNISTLIKQCWDNDLSRRPSMDEVAEVLRDEVSANCDDEVNDIIDASRRSEASLHNKYN